MNTEIIAKNLLSSLSQFQEALRASRKEISNIAIHSFHSPNTCQQFCDEMINKMRVSNDLEQLHEKLELMLARTPDEDRKLLFLHYTQRHSVMRISQLLNMNKRTVCRKLSSAIKKFAERMKYYDITDTSYSALLAKQKWLAKRHARIEHGKAI